MQKKIVSFVVILLSVTLVAYLGFGSYIQKVITKENSPNTVSYAYTLTNKGDNYFVETSNGKNSIKGIDTAGNVILSKSVSQFSDASKYKIDKIYVTSERNIYVSVLNCDYSTELINGVTIFMLSEDGKMQSEIFKREIKLPIKSKNIIISNFSEDDEKLYFAYRTEEYIEYFEQTKFTNEKAEKISIYECENEIFAFAALSDERVAVSYGESVECLSRTGNVQWFSIDDAVIDEIWNGADDKMYFSNSGEKSIGKFTTQEYTPSMHYAGNTEIDEELTIEDFNEITVNALGNITAIYRLNGSEEIYTGGNNFISKISKSVKTAFDYNILCVVVIFMGVIILTILLFDLYQKILKGKLPNKWRQSIAIALITLISFTGLATVVVGPGLDSIMRRQYEQKAGEAAQIIKAGLENGMDSTTVSDIAEQAHLGSFSENNYSNPIRISVFDISEEDILLSESSNGYYKGTPIQRIYGSDLITKEMKNAFEDNYTTFELSEPTGNRIYTMILSSDSQKIIVTSINTYAIQNVVTKLNTYTGVFLSFVMVFMIVCLLLLRYSKDKYINQLTINIKDWNSGNYGACIPVKSGDELEDLSEAIDTLIKAIPNNRTAENLDEIEQDNSLNYEMDTDDSTGLPPLEQMGRDKFTLSDNDEIDYVKNLEFNDNSDNDLAFNEDSDDNLNFDEN